MFNMLVACVACAACASCLFTAPSQNTEFDCILITYEDGQERAAMRRGSRIASDTGERVVVYPVGFVPILVPVGELDNLKKQLGDKMLILSPTIQ